MTQPHLSTTALAIVLLVVAIGFYGLIKLYGSWIDGKEQKAREKEKRAGQVKAREDEDE